MGVGSESVLRFWLEVLLGCPNWLKERNVLLLLDTLSMAAFFKHNWTEILQAKLLEAYRVYSILCSCISLYTTIVFLCIFLCHLWCIHLLYSCMFSCYSCILLLYSCIFLYVTVVFLYIIGVLLYTTVIFLYISDVF